MKRLKHSQAGFSLIDMIMGLSIIAVAIVGVQLAQRNYVEMSTQVETNLRAVTLGNSVMNTIRMHRFDENTSSPWAATLGADGESSMSDYDDIDDYAGASWDFSSDGFAGYTVSTRVFCINLDTSWLDSVAVGQDYKRIIVSVNHPAMDVPAIMTSIFAGIEG